MPDNDLFAARVESIARCLRRITDRTPEKPSQLVSNLDAQDIVSVNLQRVIQISVDLGAHLIVERGWETPTTMAETFDVLAAHGVIDGTLAERLRRAVGFRNISVHEYDRIDWERVWVLLTTRLDDFRTFVARLNALKKN